MRVYGVDPERTPVTHDAKCPMCHKGTIRVRLRIGESVQRICPECEETVVVQWVLDEPTTPEKE